MNDTKIAQPNLELTEPTDSALDLAHKNLNPIYELQTKYFREMQLWVWGVAGFYSLFFWLVDAFPAAIPNLVVFAFFCPLIAWLEKNGHTNLSRPLFIFTCNCEIYFTSLMLSHSASSEYYYLPTAMLPMVLLDSRQRKSVAGWTLFSLGLWVVTVTAGFSFVPAGWLTNSDGFALLRTVNFIGAFFLSLVLLTIFMRMIYEMKEIVVAQAVDENRKINSILTQMEEAQQIAKVGSWQFGLQGGEVKWSSELFRIFEIPNILVGDALYLAYRARIHPEDIAELDRLIQRAIQFGEEYTITHRIVLEDSQRIKFVRGHGKAFFGGDGKALYLSGTCQDVTAAVEMEKDLAQQRLLSIQNSKMISLGEMAAGVAHEINNPLATISVNADLLEVVKDSPERFVSKVSAIRRSVARIAKIVSGLRKFSRFSAITHRANARIADIVTESVAMAQPKALRFETQIDLEVITDAEIHCDQLEIEQVILNLIDNAIDVAKFYESRWVKVKAFELDNQVIVQVSDPGSGISADVALKLFEPFYTTKPVGEGTGLGLSIVKGILDSHKAQVRVNPASATTCFEVVFEKAIEARNVA